MPVPTAVRVRFAIVGILSSLALGFLLSPSQAQPGRPPTFPKPPTFPNPSIPNPTFPKPPSIPPIRPPSMPTFVDEWRCSRCNHLVGTGPVKPAVSQCPSCGVRFSNGGAAPPPAGGFNPPPSKPNNNGEPAAPPLPTNPAVQGDGLTFTPNASSAPAATAPESSTPSASPSPSGESSPPSDSSPPPASSKSGSKAFLALVIVLGLLLLLGAAALGFIVMKTSQQPTRRSRRQKACDLDD